MLIYSKTTETFLRRIRTLAKSIMAIEMGLKFSGKRVLINGVYYPLNFVVCESKTILGLYDPKLFQVALNKQLMFEVSEDILKNVLRHEIAHFMVAVNHKYTKQDHGVEFRSIFEKYSWNSTFSKSQIDLSKSVQRDEKEKKLLDKVDKLLNLATSSNEHEAQLATQRANDLMLKHNLNSSHKSDDEVSHVLRVMEYSRRSAKHDGIYEILKEFHVHPIFNQGHGGGYLEVIGSKTNILLAEYISHFIERAIEEIWKEVKLENPKIKGTVAKNSFTRSFCSEVAKGIKNSNSEENQSSNREIVTIMNELQTKVERVYPRLRVSYSKAKKDKNAASIGSSKGKKFKINPAIKNKGRSSTLLSWLK